MCVSDSLPFKGKTLCVSDVYIRRRERERERETDWSRRVNRDSHSSDTDTLCVYACMPVLMCCLNASLKVQTICIL